MYKKNKVRAGKEVAYEEASVVAVAVPEYTRPRFPSVHATGFTSGEFF
jgi:hypothetical protein